MTKIGRLACASNCFAHAEQMCHTSWSLCCVATCSVSLNQLVKGNKHSECSQESCQNACSRPCCKFCLHHQAFDTDPISCTRTRQHLHRLVLRGVVLLECRLDCSPDMLRAARRVLLMLREISRGQCSLVFARAPFACLPVGSRCSRNTALNGM